MTMDASTQTMPEIELWSDIPRYPGYQVGSLGHVRSYRVRPEGKLLRQAVDTRRYAYVCLCNDDGPQKMRVHRMVAHAFCEHVSGAAFVDHINMNKLDNRVENLRWVTHSQNSQNKAASGKSSFHGVCWSKRCKKWAARIMKDGKSKHLGYFSNEEDAARAYDAAARILYGSHARTNFRLDESDSD